MSCLTRKGLSPLIAAVMLLSFAMVMGSMFSVWSQELVRDSQKKTSNSSDQVRSCSMASIEVVERNSSFVRLQQVSGENPVGKITVTWFYEDGVEQSSGSITSVGELTGIFSGYSGDLDEFEVHPTECEEASIAY